MISEPAPEDAWVEPPNGFAATRSGVDPDAGLVHSAEDGAMSYAIVWSENDERPYTGRLELTSAAVALTGYRAGAPEARRQLSLEDLEAAYLERGARAKLPWEPALVLVTRDGDRVAIGSLEGLGALHELADAVACGRGKAVA